MDNTKNDDPLYYPGSLRRLFVYLLGRFKPPVTVQPLLARGIWLLIF